MAFELYGMLGDKAPDITLDSMASDLRRFFSRTEGFHLELEDDPFGAPARNVLLSWGGWWMRVFYESGPDVAAESAAIAVFADAAVKENVAHIDRRIRVLVADDEDREHTNHAIFMMDFLREISDATIFDPQQQAFL